MYMQMNGGMGAEPPCPSGFYRDSLFKVCLPKGGTIAQTGKSLYAQGVSQTPEIRAAAKDVAEEAITTKAVRYIRENPLHIVAGLAVIGGLAFMLGRGSK